MTELVQIVAEAAAWVARIDGDQWDDASEGELQAWLQLDQRHRGALLQMQAAWSTLDDAEVAIDTQPGRTPLYARRNVLAGGGAAIAASLAGGIVWTTRPANYTTRLGEIRRVPLADGSVATINTASRIEVKLAEDGRNVRLNAGEAWFQVAKDRHRPFVVAAGRARVRAVGTAFSVRRFDGGAEILVTEGVVEAWADGADGHRIRLTPGQGGFVAENAAISSAPARPVTVERALAWRAGKIDLLGEPLADAIAEFNRYNDRQLVLGDPALAAERLDGVFWVGDPAGFAAAVRSTLDAPIDLSDPDHILIGREKI